MFAGVKTGAEDVGEISGAENSQWWARVNGERNLGSRTADVESATVCHRWLSRDSDPCLAPLKIAWARDHDFQMTAIPSTPSVRSSCKAEMDFVT